MQYSTLLVAAAAFCGFAAAQNSSATGPLPAGIQPCCQVSAGVVPDNTKSSWCRAALNTCPEICGGQGQIASGGNECIDKDLSHKCECRNGTKPDMNKYQQSVEGLMCRYWFDQCINATNQDAGLQFTCTQTRDSMCGNLTTTPESASTSSSASMTSRTTGGSGSSPTGSSGSSESSSAPKPAAAVPAFEYSTLTLVGGLAAVFGLVL